MGVVTGVSEIVSAVDLKDARVFDAAILLVIGFGGEDGLWAHGEMQPIAALCVADAGRVFAVLRAEQQDSFRAHFDCRWIEQAKVGPSRAGPKERSIREAVSGDGDGLGCGGEASSKRGGCNDYGPAQTWAERKHWPII